LFGRRLGRIRRRVSLAHM